GRRRARAHRRRPRGPGAGVGLPAQPRRAGGRRPGDRARAGRRPAVGRRRGRARRRGPRVRLRRLPGDGARAARRPRLRPRPARLPARAARPRRLAAQPVGRAAVGRAGGRGGRHARSRRGGAAAVRPGGRAAGRPRPARARHRLRDGAVPLRGLRGRGRAGGRPVIELAGCPACGHAHCPPRAACPRCHGTQLRPVPCREAVVEQVTVDAAGTRLASLRTDRGAVVVGRLEQDVPAGTVVPVSAWREPGAAFVPGGTPLLPTHRSPVRDLPDAERTVPRLLERQARRYGDKPLVVHGGATWSYRAAVERAARAAGAMAARGVAEGDRVALLCGNRLELLEIVLGCAWLGAIAVPLNTALRGAGL